MAKHLEPEFSDEDDFDEEYFTRTYRPLSNLPTPPPSSRDTSAAQSPKSLLEDGGLLDSALLGPAIHLVNLIPAAASLATPSVPLVHDMLLRADLPLETIALAVCILDSLSSRFSLNWRLLCPLAQRDPVDHASKRHTFSVSPAVGQRPTNCNQLHIDCVNPEVIILASLVIAVKFLEDRSAGTSYYRLAWGDDMWTSEQLNVTERCIMESLGYRILPLCDPELLADAIDDMDRAGRQALPPLHGNDQVPGPAHTRSVSSGGRAVIGLGIQLTPVETPVSEKGPAPPRFTQPVVIDGTMRDTFPGPALVRDSLRLPVMKRNKSFYDSE
ncbi:hypothetical protein QBC34DRAFT_375508 [Podospora aff. communis PSN243]|uniref:Cyclin N-terminal domain-containing protein n=1 Tax=Podospora aff. communis PSN243 TaxID=3040156 RepID=A0AAV9H1D4_9PEZI|nr:hypothetical protein QBC34DRAFT_375508 [Podospora aff. communis PSN243]